MGLFGFGFRPISWCWLMWLLLVGICCFSLCFEFLCWLAVDGGDVDCDVDVAVWASVGSGLEGVVAADAGDAAVDYVLSVVAPDVSAVDVSH